MLSTNKFNRIFTDEGKRSAVAAAISRRWTMRTIAESYHINLMTVKAMRYGLNGKYAAEHAEIEEIGGARFIKKYLRDDMAKLLDLTQRRIEIERVSAKQLEAGLTA